MSVETSSLSLTGPGSHVLRREPGVGSCVIGGPRADLAVAPGDRIDWAAFDGFTTPAGGLWPRWFEYHGDDEGFLSWAATRPIEGFRWYPSSPHDVDATEARIRSLSIRVPEQPLRVRLPEDDDLDLELSGRIDQFSATGPSPRGMTLSVRTSADPEGPAVVLAGVPGLESIESLTITHAPLGRPVSLTSLRAYPRLRSLALHGAFTDFDVLEEFPELETLALRFVPVITGLPPLASFSRLSQFIGWNIAADPGASLRSEVRTLGKAREMTYSSVSPLRSPDWFAKEYGLPYAGWPSSLAKRATKAHRAAQAMLTEATTADEAEAALVDFVRVFNGMAEIETSEREDIGVAVAQLVAPVGGLISAERAQEMFDETRDY